MSFEERLEELLSPLVSSTLGVSAPEGPEQLTKVQEFLVEAEDPSAGFAWLAERLKTLPPTAACWVAVYLGGLVERGRLEASVSGPGVLAVFRQAVAAWVVDADDAEWQACAGLLGPATITQVSADETTLGELRADSTLLAQVAELAPTNDVCRYVDGLARQESGQLVLVDPEGKRAVLVNYENLGSIGHLITLLQSVLPSAWSERRTQAPEMLAVAWGENPLTDETPGDEAWFLYSHAVKDPASAVAINPDNVVSSLGLSGTRQVLTVFTSVIGEQTWTSSAFAPQLSLTPPSLSIVRDLSRSEIITLLA